MQADAANRAKSEFLARMSHELRTPLDAILGHLQILGQRRVEPELRQRLSIIRQSGEHLLTLISDLLNFSKIEAGRMELAPEPLAFPAFLEAIADIMRARAEARGLAVVLDASDVPNGVIADETRLREVLFNLLGNAVKFATTGPVTLRVRCLPLAGPDSAATGDSQQGTGDSRLAGQALTAGTVDAPTMKAQAPVPAVRVCFEVEDVGAGIARDDLERIFRPFEQVGERSRRGEGTGLGLSIAREIVRLMGGELWVQSEVGRGSRFGFDVVLPLSEDAAAAAALAERRILGYRGPRRSVLVVDDVPTNRRIIVDLLQPLGFDVSEAADGAEGVRTVLATRPDLVLMDIRMPVLDGRAAVRRLRATPEVAGLPVIAMSASVSMIELNETIAAGFDAFLPKPVLWPQLADTLRTFLQIEWVDAAPVGTPSSDDATHPPAEVLEPLMELALLGDLTALAERTDRLEALHASYAPFAERLRELAESFEEQAVLGLLKRAMNGAEQTTT